MNTEVINSPLTLEVFGLGAIADNKDYSGTAFKLSRKMWEIIKTNNIKNKGKNIWIYENGDAVFTGVELEDTGIAATLGLGKKMIRLDNYAYHKHIGPYKLIQQAGQTMRDELASKGYKTQLPYIEIYGHWTGDESTSETELLMSLTH